MNPPLCSSYLVLKNGSSFLPFPPNSELGKELVEKYTRQDDGDSVRAPLPVKRDVLYDSPMLYRYTTFFLFDETHMTPIYMALCLIGDEKLSYFVLL